jgi:hypothetical protein
LNDRKRQLSKKGKVMFPSEVRFAPHFTITNRITSALTRIERARGLGDVAQFISLGIRGRSSVYKFISSRRKPTGISIEK